MKAALSLDLDNKWSYMKTHGDAGWTDYPSYLDRVIPRSLKALDEFGLRITFFAVGQDAALARNADAFAQLRTGGHEVGNHSFHHEPWMHRRTEKEIDEECARAEESIESATGQRPRGFRGPGFAYSEAMLRSLAARGYAYDASTLPTFIGPLARAYYFKSVKLSAEEMKQRSDLFGSFSDGFRRNRAHRVPVNGSAILEIPVTTMPGLRLPIHISYVLYIAAALSPRAALAYFRAALRLCAVTRTVPSILLHPLDFLTGSECPELAFFPAMNADAGMKSWVVAAALSELSRNFDVVPLKMLASL